MSRSLRWWGALSLAALAAVGVSESWAQPGARMPFPAQKNPFIAPGLRLQQALSNTRQIGQTQAANLGAVGLTGANLSRVLAAEGLGLGGNLGAPFNPALAGGFGGGPSLSPFSLSTAGGFNPWLTGGLGGGGGATLSTSPYGSGGYSLSTSPSSYTPYGGGYDYINPLQGLASYTDAAGKYWINIGQAQLIREEARRSRLDTARKQIEFDMWWDKVRPTAAKMRDQEMATDLDRARKDPPKTEIWSGWALNALLRSINNTGKLNRGPNLPLSEEVLKHINLTDATSNGNIGMLKKVGTLSWPLPLQEEPFDKIRKRLTLNLQLAVATLKDKEPVELGMLKNIDNDSKTLNNTLNESADALTPAQYIETKRFLNQLKGAIRVLQDAKAVNYFNNTWIAKGENVAELVNHMNKEGLQFAPAAPGDEAAYTALYQSLRAFESGMQSATK